MTYESLLALARRFEGKTPETVPGKRFKVGVYLDCPFFTPESTGRGQRATAAPPPNASWHATTRSGAFAPLMTLAFTRNASY